MKTVAVSLFGDPVHIGHIELMEKAKSLGDKLIVILNTDEQAIRKKGYVFMPFEERYRILRSFWFVDGIVMWEDKDQTVCETLKLLKPDIFANGGDRSNDEIPEAKVCKELGIKIVDGLGEKIQSSSELVAKSKEYKSDE